MAIFGRESERDRQRAERVRAWVQARSGFALASGMFGVLAVLDSFTGVLGVLCGGLAIGLGLRGVSEIRQHPERLGRRWCYAGIVCGSIGLAIGATVWIIAIVT